MGKTTFSQKNRFRPAPRSWRKFENGALMILIPAATLMIQGWGFKDEALATKINLFVSTGLVSVIKFIGVMLANGEVYSSAEPKPTPEA